MKNLFVTYDLFVPLLCLGARARPVYLSETTMASVRVTPGRSTILSFPVKPNKVVLGNQGLFAVEYVENDLAIAALKGPARSNLFVYMEGRRFAFDIATTPEAGDEVIQVRDSVEKQIEKLIRGNNAKGSRKR